jgi:hypothetical protein
MKKLQIGLLFFAFLSYGEDNALIEYVYQLSASV